jgi:hypothetical protein
MCGLFKADARRRRVRASDRVMRESSSGWRSSLRDAVGRSDEERDEVGKGQGVLLAWIRPFFGADNHLG